MRFVPYAELGGERSIIVDGSAAPGTVLTLSHWPRSGTPAELKADSSAAIVFRYLDRPERWVDARSVSNNHLDEDGLLGIFALVSPDVARRHRALVEDAASAGDFARCETREAARVAFTLSALADKSTSPLDPAIFALPYQQRLGALYRELLPVVPDLLARPERFRALWETEDAALDGGERAMRDGRVKLEEIPELDLTVVTLPEDLHSVHPIALHGAARGFRILRMRGRRYDLSYRYESWVQYVSRRPLPRVDLGPLAEDLTHHEVVGSFWTAGTVDELTPSLRLVGAEESRILPSVFRERVVDYLAGAKPAWDPYVPS